MGSRRHVLPLRQRRRTVIAHPPQSALGILDVGAGVQIARVVHQQHRVLLEHDLRHVLAHAPGGLEQVGELLDRRVGVGVRGGRVAQYVLAEADVRARRRGLDVEQLARDGVLALEELRGHLEVEFVAAQHSDGLWGEQAGEVIGAEEAEDAAAMFVRVDDVEAEEARGGFFKGGVGVPGEFAQRVGYRDRRLAGAFGVHAFGLVLDVPERALRAAVGVGIATHPVDDVEDESAVRVRPPHLDGAYAVFPDGVGVHPCHGQADLTIRGFEEGGERELELGGRRRCAFLGHERVGGGHFAEVIKLLEGSIAVGEGGCICYHGEGTRLPLGWTDVPSDDGGGFGRAKRQLDGYGIARPLCEPGR